MKRLFSLFLLVIACVSARAGAATVKTTPWHPVYVGIDQASGSIDGSDASVAYALRVDLRAPGIRFYTAPRQGSLNTVASTTSQFLLKYGLQAAINANFFAPCCNAANEEKTVLGLAVSDGNTVSAPDGTPGQMHRCSSTRRTMPQSRRPQTRRTSRMSLTRSPVPASSCRMA